MPSNHLILCRPLLLPPIPPSIRVFSNESTLRMKWPKYWSFSFSISPSKENYKHIKSSNFVTVTKSVLIITLSSRCYPIHFTFHLTFISTLTGWYYYFQSTDKLPKFLLKITQLESNRAGIQPRSDLVSEAHASDHYTPLLLCAKCNSIYSSVTEREHFVTSQVLITSEIHWGKGLSFRRKTVLINAEGIEEPLGAECLVDWYSL